jgi:hypothetical protein
MEKLYFAFDFVMFAFTLWCARSCLFFSSSSLLVPMVHQASIPLPQFRCCHKALACRCLLKILIHFSVAMSAQWSPVLFSILALGHGLLCPFLFDLILPLMPEIWVPIFLFSLVSQCVGQEHVCSGLDFTLSFRFRSNSSIFGPRSGASSSYRVGPVLSLDFPCQSCWFPTRCSAHPCAIRFRFPPGIW